MRNGLGVVAVLAALVMASSAQAQSTDQAVAQWNHACAVAGGEIVDNPDALDCVKYPPTPFRQQSLAQLERICTDKVGGTFDYQVHDTAHAYCFPPA